MASLQTHVPAGLANVALERCEGQPFERFANAFFSCVLGSRFIPLGGVGDGGADAFLEAAVFEEESRPTHFFQTSIEADVKAKIRKTAKRLREVGRTVDAITHVSSHTVPKLDLVERELSIELSASIRIRDAGYISSHINDEVGTRAAFDDHLRHYADFLKNIGGSGLPVASKHASNPAVYVFLQQEIERRSGNSKLSDAVVDSLVLWALEGTDPDQDRLMSAQEILVKIRTELPHANTLLDGSLEGRLRALSSKSGGKERSVRWHRKEDAYCLPFETRRLIEDENLEDENLRIEVMRRLEQRANQALAACDESEVLARVSAAVALRAAQRMFECEGLELSHFVTATGNQSQDVVTGTEAVAFAMDEQKVKGSQRVQVGEAALAALSGAFYDSSEPERTYFAKLSKTYALFFTMAAEPRIVDYFQEMAGDFYLYVGSDVLVRALSERYLHSAGQMTRNTLLMAQRMGAKLVLTEAVVDEVWHHLRASDKEFQNHFAAVEAHVTPDIVKQIPKILVRAYFHAKLNPDAHQSYARNWPQYIGQFTTYQSLHKPSGMQEVRGYFEKTLNMTFRTEADLARYADDAEVAQLTSKMAGTKSLQQLERNDALMVSAVYGRRKARRESSASSEFGLSTWWLTDETTILGKTPGLVAAHGGDRYMMRPDFLLNFLGLSPKANDVRRSFAAVFPTLLGLRLAKRMDDVEFHKLMDKVAEAKDLEPGRIESAMGGLSDRLKGDFRKQYAYNSR